MRYDVPHTILLYAKCDSRVTKEKVKGLCRCQKTYRIHKCGSRSTQMTRKLPHGDAHESTEKDLHRTSA